MSTGRIMKSTWLLLATLYFGGCGNSTSTQPVLSSKFSDIQKQTFSGSCAIGGCHDAASQKSLLCLTKDSCYSQLMDHTIQALQGTRKFTKLVYPGKPDSSFLVYKLTISQTTTEYGSPMPQGFKPLPQNQIDAIRTWIANGAQND